MNKNIFLEQQIRFPNLLQYCVPQSDPLSFILDLTLSVSYAYVYNKILIMK